MLKVPCAVCTTLTPFSSRRYGGLCCNSCAAFFSRSISDEHLFVCMGDNNCVKEPAPNARACRRCRFDKCIEIGMTCVEWVNKISNNGTLPAAKPTQHSSTLSAEIEKSTISAKYLEALLATSFQFPFLLEQYLTLGDPTLLYLSANPGMFIPFNSNPERINCLTLMFMKYPISQDELSIFSNICLCFLEFKLYSEEVQNKFRCLQGLALQAMHQQNPNISINRFIELITSAQRFLYIFYAFYLKH